MVHGFHYPLFPLAPRIVQSHGVYDGLLTSHVSSKIVRASFYLYVYVCVWSALVIYINTYRSISIYRYRHDAHLDFPQHVTILTHGSLSRLSRMPLNKMTVETHMTTFPNIDAVNYYPDDGVFVHGLFMEGARWSTMDEIPSKYTVGTNPATECGGVIVDSNPKELLWLLPVCYVKAVETKPMWEPTSVGYLRHDPLIYECPVYLTRFRGPTYVLLATMPTDCGREKWVLRGVAILFQDDN
jgi:hypothetical protein